MQISKNVVFTAALIALGIGALTARVSYNLGHGRGFISGHKQALQDHEAMRVLLRQGIVAPLQRGNEWGSIAESLGQ